MKRLLLVSTAIAGVALLSSPASAAAKLDLGGFFRGYGVHTNNNDLAATNLYTTAFRRDSEVHVTGETTLDNGLTVGGHTEMKVGNGAATVTADEVYAYASGGWGRVNLGVEDGAAYLLQVAASSADSNVDGIRTSIWSITAITSPQPEVGTSVLANSGVLNPNKVLDYQAAESRGTDRISFLTPKYNGFQAGVSYAPQSGVASNTGVMGSQTGTVGAHTIAAGGDTSATFDNLWEASARWDGEYQGFGISAGAGYSASSLMLEATSAVVLAATGGQWFLNDGVTSYNGGLNLNWNSFSLGGNYMRAITGRTAQTVDAADLAANVRSGDISQDTYVVGAGLDNGPYHVGASYLHQQTDYDTLGTGVQAIASSKYTDTKTTIGGGYTFGPGMTFRGSVAFGDLKNSGNNGTNADLATVSNYTAAANNRYTQVAIGTDIQF